MKKTVFTMPDHLTLTGTPPDARPHHHDFLHLLIMPQPGGLTIGDTLCDSPAVLISGGVVHQIVSHPKAPQMQPYWLTLIDHTSPLAACLHHQWLTGDNRRFCDISAVIAPLLPQISDFLQQPEMQHKAEYLALWNGLTGLLRASHCYDPHDIPDARINAVIAAVQGDTPLPLQDNDLLANIYLSRSRLSHLFTDTTGSSLKSYILFHRVIRALLMVAQGQKVTDAALAAGFDSPSHFSAACRRLTGIQPRFARQVSEFLKVSP